MGKIRVKTFDESQEEKDKKREAQREAKKQSKSGQKIGKVAGMGGGERTVMVGPTEEELAQTLDQTTAETSEETSGEKVKAKKAKFLKQKVQGKRYQANRTKVNRDTIYPLSQAVELLKSLQTSKFDETIELHINVKEKGITGTVSLPHGTGKKLRIAVADDALIAQVEKGKIEFDILVAQPQMMPKLAKVARVLGPRGLMPNPKNGTVSPNPEEVIKKLSAGQINYKTEATAPIIHMTVGKVSFEDAKISENIKTVLSSIGQNKITSVILKSTMSPAIKVNIATS